MFSISIQFAVFKRNFFAYLANPTGYVFIGVFVLLCSVAAFLPDEFFNTNLASLDQLNLWFPLIMLVFVPAITMGIWTEERKQGTDELLLTSPANDLDILLGKFRAAVMIYILALLFSLVSNWGILCYLGHPDSGLFLATYIGYGLVGIAMLSIGMIASFLSTNLTVSYILGAIFCVPFIAIQWAASAPIPENIARFVAEWSIPSQFSPFGRGIIPVSNFCYFFVIVVTCLYGCLVLMGCRRWTAHRHLSEMTHSIIRVTSLFVLGMSVCFIVKQHNMRFDLTEERLSTLSPQTIQLLKSLHSEYPVAIDAYLSQDVPEWYAQTRLDIVATLDAIQATCGSNVSIQIHDIKPNTEEALIADQRFGMKPQMISYTSRGVKEQRPLFMGVAFRCGLRTVSLPFIDRGLSVEYELIHAFDSVIAPKKKRIGILKTDAPLFGRFNPAMYTMLPQWQMIDELQKRFTLVEVDPLEPIRERFDVLIAVQPSAMGLSEMNHFVGAIRTGQPTIIFEDPLPIYVSESVPGTSMSRIPESPMLSMLGRTMPKGDLSQLWNLLGVQIDGGFVAWQDYSPIRKLAQIPQGFVFLDRSGDDSTVSGTKRQTPFHLSDPATKYLDYLMLPLPGSITPFPVKKNADEMKQVRHIPVLRTFQKPAGTAKTKDVIDSITKNSNWNDLPREELEKPINLAVRIQGCYTNHLSSTKSPTKSPEDANENNPETVNTDETVELNVLLVADIDILSDALFQLRRLGNMPGSGINLNFDSVSFLLNAIDDMTGDERFLTIRNRRPKYRTLSKFDESTDEFRQKAGEQREMLQKEFESQKQKAESKLQDTLKHLEKQLESGELGDSEAGRKMLAAEMAERKRLSLEILRLEWKRKIDTDRSEVDLNEQIRRIQGRYKLAAMFIPPIPLFFVGICVFLYRHRILYEGIPESRRRPKNPIQ
ncbi:MAG: Gldg family protein [Thermoguttaceae bacterium]